jgi:hypothetical protein
MYEKIMAVNGINYMLRSDIPITPEIENAALLKLEIQTLSKTCPPYKTVGDTTTLKCTPVSGAGQFTVTFFKNGAQLSQYTGVPLNTEVIVSDVATNEDAVTGYADYSVSVIDGCTDPEPQTAAELCRVLVYLPCAPVQCNLIVI